MNLLRMTMVLGLVGACASDKPAQKKQDPIEVNDTDSDTRVMPETTETETTTEPSAGRHEVLVFFDQFATRICACVDAACTEEAFAEADATMGQLEEKYRDYEPTPEEEQEIIELGQRVEGCAARFTTSP